MTEQSKHAEEVAEWQQRAVDAEEMLRDMRGGWLSVIQQENSCASTGEKCDAKWCGCAAEQETLINEWLFPAPPMA